MISSTPAPVIQACERFEPLAVSPSAAWRLLGCGKTYGYQLIAKGELDSYRDGRTRKITVESIRRYIKRQLAQESS